MMKDIESFISYLKSRQFSQRNLQNSRKIILQHVKWLEKEDMAPEQVGYRDLLGYIQACGKNGASQRTVQNYLSTIRHYYGHLEEEGLIAANPATGIEIKGVKRKTLYHILEPHELHALYNRYRDSSLKGRRNKVMLGLLAYQGLKSEELDKLETGNIKLREGQVDVPEGRKSNGRLLQLEAHQVMDMYDYVLQARGEMLRQSGQCTEKLFVNTKGGASFGNSMHSLMQAVKKLNGRIKDVRQIRASVITKWLKIYNLREAQYLAGHRYISTTEGYLQNDMEGLKEEINKFHPLGCP